MGHKGLFFPFGRVEGQHSQIFNWRGAEGKNKVVFFRWGGAERQQCRFSPGSGRGVNMAIFSLGMGRWGNNNVFNSRREKEEATRLILFMMGRVRGGNSSIFKWSGVEGTTGLFFFNGEGQYFFWGIVHRNKASYVLEATHVYADY